VSDFYDQEAARDTAILVRATAVFGLLLTAIVHVIESNEYFFADGEPMYIAWLFMVLIAGALVAAALLLVNPSWTVWSFAESLCGAAIIAYIVSRSFGFPDASHLKGHWDDEWGNVALLVEGITVLVAAFALFQLRSDNHRERLAVTTSSAESLLGVAPTAVVDNLA
jgi:hypothetical protein